MPRTAGWERQKGFIFLCALVILWETVSRLNLANPVFLPPVSEIAKTFLNLVFSLEIPKDLAFTLYRALFGLIIASAIGIPLGILIGYFKALRETLSPAIEILRPIPSSAVIPVAMLFLGIFDWMKIAVVAFGCLWPILLNTAAGVGGIDRILLDTGRTFNLEGKKFFWEIIMKGASPYIATGVRISLAIALILAVTTEMIAGQNGLGFFIINAEYSYRFKEMYAGILAIGIAGLLLNRLFTLMVEQRLMGWYHGYTAKI